MTLDIDGLPIKVFGQQRGSVYKVLSKARIYSPLIASLATRAATVDTPEWCYDLEYQAESWESPRRVVFIVQEKPEDLLFHSFFLVTNLSYPPQKVLALYHNRGKAVTHMGELKSALNVHVSSTNRRGSTV